MGRESQKFTYSLTSPTPYTAVEEVVSPVSPSFSSPSPPAISKDGPVDGRVLVLGETPSSPGPEGVRRRPIVVKVHSDSGLRPFRDDDRITSGSRV